MPIPQPRGGYGGNYNHGRGAVVAYPLYVGSYFGDYGYGGGFGGGGYDAPPPAAAPPPPAPAPAAPPVIINQYFGAANPDAAGVNQSLGSQTEGGGVSYYQQPANVPPPSPEPPSYLIAFKDHSVYSVLAYWVEGTTVHYLTSRSAHNQADLSLVDMDLTAKLNEDKNSPFSLKPTPASARPSAE